MYSMQVFISGTDTLLYEGEVFRIEDGYGKFQELWDEGTHELDLCYEWIGEDV